MRRASNFCQQVPHILVPSEPACPRAWLLYFDSNVETLPFPPWFPSSHWSHWYPSNNCEWIMFGEECFCSYPEASPLVPPDSELWHCSHSCTPSSWSSIVTIIQAHYWQSHFLFSTSQRGPTPISCSGNSRLCGSIPVCLASRRWGPPKCTGMMTVFENSGRFCRLTPGTRSRTLLWALGTGFTMLYSCFLIEINFNLYNFITIHQI